MQKKHPRLPNGFGQIRKLSGKRRNPYGVYPPQVEEDQDGRRLPVKALCYVPTWTVAFAVLTAYNAGTYTPGLELDLTAAEMKKGLKNDSTAFVDAILADYARVRYQLIHRRPVNDPTFAEVYELFYKDKYGSGQVFAESTVRSTKTAFGNCRVLHDRPFRSLRLDDLQDVVDSCPLKHASLELIVTLFKGMYRYADAHELCDKDYSAHLKIKRQEDDEHGVPFSEEDLKTLWKHSDDPTIEMILIMCYAGYRVAAYRTIEVDLENRSFFGGNKTKSGKGLLCPIHSATFPLVKRRLERDGSMLGCTTYTLRNHMYPALERIGIQKHTPHDCKHTFSALCEKYKVNEHDRKRMLGHKIGDVTNDVYGHRTLEELREEIEKIPDLSKVC